MFISLITNGLKEAKKVQNFPSKNNRNPEADGKNKQEFINRFAT
jgi:hypothetical protein